MVSKGITKLPIWKGVGFFMILRWILILIVIISFLSSAFVVYKETGELEPVIKQVGGQIFNPLHNLGEHTNKIKETGFFVLKDSYFSSVWNFLKNIWLFIEPLIVTFLWFNIFRRIIKFLMGDITPPFYVWGFSLLFFFIIQWFYIILFTDLSMLAPIRAVGNVVEILFVKFG